MSCRDLLLEQTECATLATRAATLQLVSSQPLPGETKDCYLATHRWTGLQV